MTQIIGLTFCYYIFSGVTHVLWEWKNKPKEEVGNPMKYQIYLILSCVFLASLTLQGFQQCN